MKKVAVIVSGGIGSRMNSALPKQFIELHGKPLLMHTMEQFSKADSQIELFLVLNVDHQDLWHKLIKQYNFQIPYSLVNGGRTRFHSVKNALKVLPKKCLVAIHDAVRPLISTTTILKAFEAAENHPAVITAVPAKDSIRRVHGEQSIAIPRDELFIVQTPQVFDSQILQKAYLQDFRNEFTDDASVVEKLGIPIHLIEGEPENIKITFETDLLFAEMVLKKREFN